MLIFLITSCLVFAIPSIILAFAWLMGNGNLEKPRMVAMCIGLSLAVLLGLGAGLFDAYGPKEPPPKKASHVCLEIQ